MTAWDKIKNQFKSTVPEDYEVEFDICMKCGRRMPDRKYSTLKAHQEQNHKLTKKKKLKEIMFKYPIMILLLVFVFALPAILVGVPLLEEYVMKPVLKDFFPELYKELIDVEKCSEEVGAFKQTLHNAGNFGIEHVNEFNRLMHDCNVNFFAVIKEPPLFEQEVYKGD